MTLLVETFVGGVAGFIHGNAVHSTFLAYENQSQTCLQLIKAHWKSDRNNFVYV